MQSQLTKRGSGRELAVVLHGPHGSPEDMQGVSKALEERSKDMDILAPILPYGGGFCLPLTNPVDAKPFLGRVRNYNEVPHLPRTGCGGRVHTATFCRLAGLGR